jgi:hypothetical protein
MLSHLFMVATWYREVLHTKITEINTCIILLKMIYQITLTSHTTCLPLIECYPIPTKESKCIILTKLHDQLSLYGTS